MENRVNDVLTNGVVGDGIEVVTSVSEKCKFAGKGLFIVGGIAGIAALTMIIIKKVKARKNRKNEISEAEHCDVVDVE